MEKKSTMSMKKSDGFIYFLIPPTKGPAEMKHTSGNASNDTDYRQSDSPGED
jgi:hypothetical protein